MRPADWEANLGSRLTSDRFEPRRLRSVIDKMLSMRRLGRR